MVLSFVRSGSADINSGAVRVAGRHISVSSGITMGFVSPEPYVESKFRYFFVDSRHIDASEDSFRWPGFPIRCLAY